jgi:hypothetical protein
MPTNEELAGEPPTLTGLRTALATRAGGDENRLFALLDGARIPKLWVMLDRLGVPARGLYRGDAAEELVHVMPFVARVPLEGPLPLWLAIGEGVLETIVFGLAPATLDELQLHFRRFLTVLDAAGVRNYLRFYDPRVLPPLLEGSTDAERRQFFGAVEMFFVPEAREPDGTPRFRELRRPPGPVELPPPSATSPFQLTAHQEACLARDAEARYDAACMAWLRERFAPALQGRADEDLAATVARARSLGVALGLAGRDVTTVAEALVLGFGAGHEDEVRRAPARQRRASLEGIRDRLAAERGA